MKRVIYLLILVMLGLAACSSDNNNINRESANVSTSPARAVLVDGETTYNTYCAACHGISGEGQNPEDPYAKDENGKFLAPPHNDTGHTWHHDDDLLIRIINDGGTGGNQFNVMPAFGELLSKDQIEAVLAYIKTFWTEEKRTSQKEHTEAVRAQ